MVPIKEMSINELIVFKEQCELESRLRLIKNGFDDVIVLNILISKLYLAMKELTEELLKFKTREYNVRD